MAAMQPAEHPGVVERDSHPKRVGGAFGARRGVQGDQQVRPLREHRLQRTCFVCTLYVVRGHVRPAPRQVPATQLSAPPLRS